MSSLFLSGPGPLVLSLSASFPVSSSFLLPSFYPPSLAAGGLGDFSVVLSLACFFAVRRALPPGVPVGAGWCSPPCRLPPAASCGGVRELKRRLLSNKVVKIVKTSKIF